MNVRDATDDLVGCVGYRVDSADAGSAVSLPSCRERCSSIRACFAAS
jgi:hypothetical protein